MIPGYTDDDANLISIAKYVYEISPDITIELLNYNPNILLT